MTRKEMFVIAAEAASNAARCTRILAIPTPTVKEKIAFWAAVEALAANGRALAAQMEFPDAE